MLSHPDLQLSVIVTSMLYATIGMGMMLFFIALFDKLFKMNLHHELVEDQNVAFGVLIAGVAIGIGIIIAAAIN